MQTSGVRYEHDVVMCACDEHVSDIILLLGLHTYEADSSATLLFVCPQRDALDVIVLGYGDDDFLSRDEILLIAVDGVGVDLRTAFIPVSFLHLHEFILDYLKDPSLVRENVLEIDHQFLDVIVLSDDTVDLQSREFL